MSPWRNAATGAGVFCWRPFTSLLRSLLFQKNKKTVLRFAQQKKRSALCMLYSFGRSAQKRKRPYLLRTFCCLCYGFIFMSDDRVEPCSKSDTSDASSYKCKHILFSFRFWFADVYLNRCIQNISGDFLMSSARSQAQNAVIVISPFVSVCCVYYPKMVEMIPPTIIVVVATPSVTRQNVIIFFPPVLYYLLLLSVLMRISWLSTEDWW